MLIYYYNMNDKDCRSSLNGGERFLRHSSLRGGDWPSQRTGRLLQGRTIYSRYGDLLLVGCAIFLATHLYRQRNHSA